MNKKFFSLSKEKQQTIINAGYRVFSQNSYKNSPMREIADAAGISKSLLFHYFHNKKELYLFLWNKCAEITIEFLTRYECYSQMGLFESMERGMQAKMEIIRLYPNMGNFTIKAFYEKEPEICAAIQESYHKLKADQMRLNFDPDQFIPGIDIAKDRLYNKFFMCWINKDTNKKVVDDDLYNDVNLYEIGRAHV